MKELKKEVTKRKQIREDEAMHIFEKWGNSVQCPRVVGCRETALLG